VSRAAQRHSSTISELFSGSGLNRHVRRVERFPEIRINTIMATAGSPISLTFTGQAQLARLFGGSCSSRVDLALCREFL
jgi:hypothetical protein